MASAFTHSFVALALGKASTAEKMPLRFWVLSVVCSLLPDADILGFYFGTGYGDMLGHRGFTHSLLFALIVGLITALLAFPSVPKFSKKWRSLVLYFFTVTASHGFLDAMTNGGYGIGFFMPVDNTRYFLPWRPLTVSPIGVHGFISRWGWDVIKGEFLWVWTPMLLLLAAVTVFRKNRTSFREQAHR
jgi:inner membrane protein